MRKLWFYTILAIGFILLPNYYPVTSTAYDIPVGEINQLATDTLPRIYDTNIAKEIYNSCNLTKYRELVYDFTENGSRYIMTYADIPRSTNEDSRNWIIHKMNELSNDRVVIELEGTMMNIVATLPGYLPGEDLPIFLVTAHYDSADGSPGANTDGSGIAVVLELVRIFSKYEWPIDIQFLLFNGEHALGSQLGSKEMANQYVLSGVDILAMYNVDTIMRQNRWAPVDERVLLAYNTGAEYWAYLAKTMGNYYGGDIVGIIPSIDFPQWGASGHVHFSDRGIDNVLFAYESGYMYDDVSGTELDVWSRGEFNYYIGKEVTAFIGSSIAFTMGRGFGSKTQLIDTREISGGSVNVFYIPITTPTSINITCRWYGGGANFILNDPGDYLINSVIHTSSNAWEPTLVMNQTVSSSGLYKLNIYNPGEATIGVDLYIEYDSDIDKNGVLDSEEYWLDTALFESDLDNDTISDALEIIQGLDMYSPDGDNDNLLDAWELEVGLNPRDPLDALDDPDFDNLTTLQEYNLGLDPFSDDSDGDMMIDSWELDNGLDPLTNDAEGNPDNDQYTNYEEFMLGTDPNISDLQEFAVPLWLVVPSGAIILLGVAVYILRRR